MALRTEARPQSKIEVEKPLLTGIRVVGTGFCTPKNVVKNEDLAKLGYDSEWIIQRTGIKSRCHVTVGEEATSDLAFEAALQCLVQANLSPADLDLIIVATMTPDHATPSASSLLQGKLGCTAPVMDLNAACSGFAYAFVTAAQFVKTGCYKTVMVVGADCMSTVIDPKDTKTFPLFGDGAGAVIISQNLLPDPENPTGILSHVLGAQCDVERKLLIPSGGSHEPVSIESVASRRQYLRMDGRCVFKWAVRLIPEIVESVVAKAGLQNDDIDLFIFHQANKRIIDAAGETLGVDPKKLFVNLDRYGNTSSASIPISIHEAVEAGLIVPGSNIVVCGFGAGFAWGAFVLRW